MKKKILVEKNELTTKIAVLTQEEWTHFYIDTILEEDTQNQVVVGQIAQVVKNLNAVFVDFGETKNGLLHFKQIPACYQDKLYPGSRLPVQIVKQNVGEKGHKLTGKINLMGKFLVCLPFEEGINLSKKIQNLEVRERIKNQLSHLGKNKYGFIVRTQAQEVSEEALIEDANRLIKQADELMQVKDYLSKGSLLYKEPSLTFRVIMEHLQGEEEVEIICDSEAFIEELRIQIVGSSTQQIVFTHYKEPESLMTIYGLQKKLGQLTSRKIWLKSGGNLVVDYTEAMTIIDVNSAKAVLTKNPQKAIIELNKQAIKESILQIMRRNLSGIIIIDLVEVANEEGRAQLYEYAKTLLETYGEKRSKVFPLTELGLMQFSRTKKYRPLHHAVLKPCESCYSPYSKLNQLSQVMALEEIIKNTVLKTEHQSIYVETSSAFYDFLMQNKISNILCNAYPLNIQLKKNEKMVEKAFLCQFYQS